MRSWDGDLVGVECINWDGDKQTFGSKGQLVLGHPEPPHTFISVKAGPKSFVGVVAFGKKLREKAEEASKRYLVHRGHASRGRRQSGDVWDYWIAGHGEEYFGGRHQ